MQILVCFTSSPGVFHTSIMGLFKRPSNWLYGLVTELEALDQDQGCHSSGKLNELWSVHSYVTLVEKETPVWRILLTYILNFPFHL